MAAMTSRGKQLYANLISNTVWLKKVKSWENKFKISLQIRLDALQDKKKQMEKIKIIITVFPKA